MNFAQFLRIAQRNAWRMFFAGLLLAGVAYWSVRNEHPIYSSQTVINTGLVSGYNIESGSGAKVDFNYTNNEMENLINLATSNEILEKLALKLMAKYLLLKNPEKQDIAPENWKLIEEAFPASFRKPLARYTQQEDLFLALETLKKSTDNNFVKELLYSDHPFFGLEHLKTLTARRQGNSDLITIQYTTLDPGVCRNTLLFHTQQFIEEKIASKENQSKSVLEFFEKSTRESVEALRDKEDELLAFTVKNKIINYYEQTRYIAAEKEDLDDLYFKERMDRATADSSLRRLETELRDRVSVPELNTLFTDQREELSRLNGIIARRETFGSTPDAETQNPTKELKERVAELQQQMHTQAQALIRSKQGPEGVDADLMLSEWLHKMLDQERTKARLKVFTTRKSEFDQTYSKFAPWGSQLKRAEREIDVAERAYLENLHSYNQARLRQFSIMLTGGLRVVDAPTFPTKAELSKSKILIVAGFIVGVLLILSLAVALEIFDTNLKFSSNAVKQTGLQLAGGLPLMPKGNEKKKSLIHFDKIMDQSLFQLYQHIRTLHLGKQPTIAVLSMGEGEGKSYFLNEFTGMLTNSNRKDDFNLIELPALLSGANHISWETPADLYLLVVRANRAWTKADQLTLERFQQQFSTPIHLVVTGVHPDYMDELLGEIPKDRSPFRKKLKSFLIKVGIK